MSKKSNESDYKQVDVKAAFYGKEDFFIEKEELVVEEEQKLTPFDFVNDIRKTKKGNMLDKEENIPKFDILVANYFNKFIGSMTRKQLYLSLIHVIDQTNSHFAWIKGSKIEDSELEQYVCTYFECSISDAKEYISIMGAEWAEKIREKFGGVVSKTVSSKRGRK
jgi:hypothetical protein